MLPQSIGGLEYGTRGRGLGERAGGWGSCVVRGSGCGIHRACSGGVSVTLKYNIVARE